MHELGYTECAKSYVFRGSKDYSTKQVHDMLGLGQAAPRPNMPQQPGRPQMPMGNVDTRFLLPVSQCEFQLTNALEQLQRDRLSIRSFMHGDAGGSGGPPLPASTDSPRRRQSNSNSAASGISGVSVRSRDSSLTQGSPALVNYSPHHHRLGSGSRGQCLQNERWRCVLDSAAP